MVNVTRISLMLPCSLLHYHLAYMPLYTLNWIQMLMRYDFSYETVPSTLSPHSSIFCDTDHYLTYVLVILFCGPFTSIYAPEEEGTHVWFPVVSLVAKTCVRAKLLQSCLTLWPQAPLSMGFSRQEYWSGLPRPPPGDLPDSRIKAMSLMTPALAGGFFTTSATWEALKQYIAGV